MADWMQKTKKELVSVIKEREASRQHLENEMNQMQSEFKTIQMQLEQVTSQNRAISTEKDDLSFEMNQSVTETRRLKDELEKAHSENRQIRNESLLVRVSNEKLITQCNCLKEECDTLKERLEERTRKSEAAYELFKSFVDTDSRKVLLIDTAYTVCYVNRTAASFLCLKDLDAVIGRRFFDFFVYKDSLKIKKKIDAAFFSGEKEKIKEMVVRIPGGAEMQVNLKFMRVRYRDKPAIKMIIKSSP